MRIFLVKRTDDWGYDEVDSFICCAENEEAAKLIYPHNEETSKDIHYNTSEKKWESEVYSKWAFNTWTSDLENLKITDLGTSNEEVARPILVSFNAG